MTAVDIFRRETAGERAIDRLPTRKRDHHDHRHDTNGAALRTALACYDAWTAGDALMLYDTQTVPVRSSIVAEHLTVKDGKVTSTRMVFDQTPFASYQGGAPERVKAAQRHAEGQS